MTHIILPCPKKATRTEPYESFIRVKETISVYANASTSYTFLANYIDVFRIKKMHEPMFICISF